METKLFSIVLCLLVLEAGSSSRNLTSVQHRTEKASARSTAASTSTSTSTFASLTTTGKKGPTIIDGQEVMCPTEEIGFSFPKYERQLYSYVKAAFPQQQPSFAFLMMVPIADDISFPNEQLSNALSKKKLNVQPGEVFPAEGLSNMVITVGATTSSSTTATFPEMVIVEALPNMYAFYMETYVSKSGSESTNNYITSCPVAVILGSTTDACFLIDGQKISECAKSFVNKKTKFAKKWNCPDTIWLVYVDVVKNFDSWMEMEKVYTDNDIVMFANEIAAAETEEKKQGTFKPIPPVKEDMSETGSKIVQGPSQQSTDLSSPSKIGQTQTGTGGIEDEKK